MKVLITGAAGFLGQYVVAEALRCGHSVRAMVRPTTDVSQVPWGDRTDVELVRANLCDRMSLDPIVRDVDAVIHLAAAKSGSYSSQFSNTVDATKQLLAVMEDCSVTRSIFISSFSVYDYLHLPEGALLKETTPLDTAPDERDVYAQMKLQQEALVRTFANKHEGQVILLRPGVIYGRDHLLHAHLGAKLKNGLWISIGDRTLIPLTYVENCAAAIVKALSSPAANGQILNIVDDYLPTPRQYCKMLAECGVRVPITIPIGWSIARQLARFAWHVSRRLNPPPSLPGILVPARLHARFKPLNYTNYLAKRLLDWEPTYSPKTAIARSASSRVLPELPRSSGLWQPASNSRADSANTSASMETSSPPLAHPTQPVFAIEPSSPQLQ